MNTEILINVTSREVRAAVLDNGVLQEVLVERAGRSGLLGNIYKGHVVRVLPGMQAAFVDIGLERTAFLHGSDIARAETPDTDIGQLVRQGDELLVQITKEPLGSKGARLSTFITLPSRYVVLLPQQPEVGISSRIEDDSERERLRGMAESLFDGSGNGCILRTAAAGVSEAALRADVGFVLNIWSKVESKAAQLSGVQILHADLPLAVRVVRDLTSEDIKRICVDSADTLEEISNFAKEFMPELPASIELYEGSRPIFDLHAVDDEIDRALADKVELKSGGYLIIEQTEAMTTIDVNTGAYVGRSDQQETIVRTNLEAAVSVARHLRLRNLGGIIIIDFIDMQTEAHRDQVLEALGNSLTNDPARTQISHVSPLGLVEMTRKRTRESLGHVLCRPCPTCQGRGQIKSTETVCYEIFREILRQHHQFSFGELAILAHDDVIEMLLDEESAALAELEALTGCTMRLQAQVMHVPDEFDVVPM